MTTLKSTIQINKPGEKIWPVLADFGNIKKFNPGLRDSFLTSEQKNGLGATRHCDLKPFGSVEERIVDWKDEQFYTVEIFEGEKLPPIKNMKGTLSITESNGEKSSVEMAISYEPKYGLFGMLMNTTLC